MRSRPEWRLPHLLFDVTLSSYLPPYFVHAVELCTLRAVRLLATERGAEDHANRDADGKPDAYVSSQYTENRAYRRS
jgi:hypothetical protein